MIDHAKLVLPSRYFRMTFPRATITIGFSIKEETLLDSPQYAGSKRRTKESIAAEQV